MEQQATQRRFAVMGENLFRILNKLITNQRLCRLLKYQNEDPFSKELPDVDGLELINNSICITPKIPEKDGKETAYVMVVFDRFIVNTNNPDFKISTVRFDIACPYNEWVVDNNEQLSKPTTIHPKTKKFYRLIDEGQSFEKAVAKVTHKSFVSRVVGKTKRVLKKISTSSQYC